MKKRNLFITIAAVVTVAIILLYSFRGSIARWRYSGTKQELIGRLSPEQEERYGEDLDYTMNKFWDCYQNDLISENDMVTVMERTGTLLEKEELANADIFNFIGFVSRIYTDAIHIHNKKLLREEEEKSRRIRLEQVN